jgi:hypothetical protein
MAKDIKAEQVQPDDSTPAPDAHDHWVKDQLTYWLTHNPDFISELAAASDENAVVQAVIRAQGAGGDYGIFEQDINTTYSGALVVLYECRLIPGPITHPITKQHLPVQTTVFDDILAAIQGGK